MSRIDVELKTYEGLLVEAVHNMQFMSNDISLVTILTIFFFW